MTRTGTRVTRSLAVAALLAVTAVVAPAGAASAADGSIGGSVVHGGEGTAIGDLEVVLVELDDEGPGTELARSRTDASGRFSFAAVPGDAELEVVLRFDGAEYRSGRLAVDGGETTEVDLEVFDSTTRDDDVVIANWVVWVDRFDTMAVQQDLQVENRGERTYLGADPDAEGVRAVITVPLAPDASALRFLGRFTECCATLRGTDYVHTSPLVPGTVVGTLRYGVERLDVLRLPATLAVESFTLMVPTGTTVSGRTLELSGEIVSRGTTYDVYTAEGIDPGELLEVSLRGLSDVGVPTWQLAAAAVGLVAAAATVLLFARRRRRTKAPSGSAELAGDGAELPGSAVPSGTRPSPAEVAGARTPDPPEVRVGEDLLLEELALLDVGFERGLLPREVYEPLREARKAELLALPPRTEG
jgi:hypothetical protein